MARRADRLFRITQLLRGRRLTTAKQLADWLQVSARTVYRDVRDLQLSGVPIEGEAGVGYRLTLGVDMPPLMFTSDELDALVVGAKIVESWGSQALALGARGALAKIAASIPADKRVQIDGSRLFAPSFQVNREMRATLDCVHEAVDTRRKLSFAYCDRNGAQTERTVWPLSLIYWGSSWTIGSWCELRQDFRVFDVRRMTDIRTREPFPDESGKRLADFMRHVERAERS
jgi:predicted DNA-binding transcriptional regulator YafY